MSAVRPGGHPGPARPEGLLLAAGAGRRLSRGPKALLRHRGVTLVEHVAEAMLDGGCRRVTVVCGAGARDVEGAVGPMPGVRCVENRNWNAGMGTSLRLGLETIGSGSEVLVMPVDQPGVGPAVIERVISSHHRGMITAAAHRDPAGDLWRGHPVLFDASWVPAAATAAHGDVGARDLLGANPDAVRLVDCTDLDDGADVDEPADLARLSP